MLSPAIPRIPVRAGLVDVHYLQNPKEAQQLQNTLKQWKKRAGQNPSPAQRDAAEFAPQMVSKWRQAFRQKRAAPTLKRIEDMIRDQPSQEIQTLAIARTSWLKHNLVVGVCLFRRTWCNNIALDLLATDPKFVDMEHSPISGLGSGLIHHVCFVAQHIQAGAIWGECTQNSDDFYDTFVGRRAERDLIVLKRQDYLDLKRNIEDARSKETKSKV